MTPDELDMRGNISFFNFGRANHLDLTPIVSDEDLRTRVGWWLNGRIFGRYVSWYMPTRKLGDKG